MFQHIISTYRNAYAGLTRETWLLSLIMLINRSGTMVVPFMTLYMTSPEMGYSLAQAGVVFGIFGLGSFTGAYCGGVLTDRLGFYAVQLGTLVCGGLLFMVLGYMDSYLLICLVSFLVSFVNEAFRPANATAVAYYSKAENFSRSNALNRLAINLGWAIGGALAGILADISFKALFWVDGFTNLFAALLMWNLLGHANGKAQATESKPEAGPSPYRDTTYLVFILITTIFGCCFFQMATNLPVYLETRMALSTTIIGVLFAWNGLLIVMFEMALIYRLESWGKPSTVITVGIALTALSFVVLNIPLAGLAMPVLMMTLLTFGEMFSMPFMNTYWINRSRHSNRGQYAALYTMAWAAAMCVGPVVGALAAERYGFTVLWYFTGIVGCLAAFAFWLLTRKPRHVAASDEDAEVVAEK